MSLRLIMTLIGLCLILSLINLIRLVASDCGRPGKPYNMLTNDNSLNRIRFDENYNISFHCEVSAKDSTVPVSYVINCDRGKWTVLQSDLGFDFPHSCRKLIND